MANKTYKGTDFEVLWQPSVCIHSKKCWENSQEVFNPFRRPWIMLENGEKEAIKKTVLACPSGALQWIEKSESAENSTGTEKNPESEILHAEVKLNGPLQIKGNFMLVHADGKREIKEKSTFFCRCGASNNKPYCDGSHNKIEFKG
jgi:uncharacterized Fe-S cluster protein YjdI